MVKKFTVPCNFVNGQGKFDVWIGDPAPGCHPLKYQEAWLEQNRGGRINTEVMDSFQKLYKLLSPPPVNRSQRVISRVAILVYILKVAMLMD